MKASIALAFVSLATVVGLQSKFPQPHLTDQIVFEYNERFSNFSSSTVKFLSLGYARAASSVLWLRFLQETPPKKVEKNQISWTYLDLRTVTELDPDFYPAYSDGGIFLSVITEDKRGAEQILLRGTEAFPRDWRLRSYLGYHYQFELQEAAKAAEQYRVGAQLPGAPALMKVLSVSYTDKFQGKPAALALLEEMLKKTEDPVVRSKLEDKLRRLKKEGEAHD